MPKIVDHEQKRLDLLTNCFSLFAQRGYHSVTMREIARELKVSTGTLYHYFPNKEALFGQMFEVMSQRDVVEASAELATDASLPEQLAVLFGYLSKNESYFQHLLLMALDFYRYQPDESTGPLHQTLASYREALERELKLPDPSLATALLSFLIGMITHHLMDPADVTLVEHRDFLVRFVSLLELQPSKAN